MDMAEFAAPQGKDREIKVKSTYTGRDFPTSEFDASLRRGGIELEVPTGAKFGGGDVSAVLRYNEGSDRVNMRVFPDNTLGTASENTAFIRMHSGGKPFLTNEDGFRHGDLQASSDLDIGFSANTQYAFVGMREKNGILGMRDPVFTERVFETINPEKIRYIKTSGNGVGWNNVLPRHVNIFDEQGQIIPRFIGNDKGIMIQTGYPRGAESITGGTPAQFYINGTAITSFIIYDINAAKRGEEPKVLYQKSPNDVKYDSPVYTVAKLSDVKDHSSNNISLEYLTNPKTSDNLFHGEVISSAYPIRTVIEVGTPTVLANGTKITISKVEIGPKPTDINERQSGTATVIIEWPNKPPQTEIAKLKVSGGDNHAFGELNIPDETLKSGMLSLGIDLLDYGYKFTIGDLEITAAGRIDQLYSAAANRQELTAGFAIAGPKATVRMLGVLKTAGETANWAGQDFGGSVSPFLAPRTKRESRTYAIPRLEAEGNVGKNIDVALALDKDTQYFRLGGKADLLSAKGKPSLFSVNYKAERSENPSFALEGKQCYLEFQPGALSWASKNADARLFVYNSDYDGKVIIGAATEDSFRSGQTLGLGAEAHVNMSGASELGIKLSNDELRVGAEFTKKEREIISAEVRKNFRNGTITAYAEWGVNF